MINKEELKFNKNIGLYYDPKDISDKIAIKECIKNYSDLDYTNKTCLDIGANIGGFSVLALNGGAEKVISVECDERNFELLSYNLKEKNVELIYGAASNKDGEVSVLKKTNSKRKNISVKTSEAMYRKNSSYVEVCKVKSYDIYGLIDKYKPDVFKVDIEGAEFLCFEDVNKKINSCVKEMLIEIHITKINTLNKLQHILDQFDELDIDEHISFNRVISLDVYLKRK